MRTHVRTHAYACVRMRTYVRYARAYAHFLLFFLGGGCFFFNFSSSAKSKRKKAKNLGLKMLAVALRVKEKLLRIKL